MRTEMIYSGIREKLAAQITFKLEPMSFLLSRETNCEASTGWRQDLKERTAVTFDPRAVKVLQ